LNEDNFVPAIEENEIKENSMKLVTVAVHKILLAKYGGQVYGVSNRCPHMGCSLSAGTLKEYIVTCPCHGWSFDTRNGQYQKAKEITLMTYECKTQNGKVLIRMIDDV
jgi:nitrite reductase/ring-hydroxylating ferredoxin subunit